MKKIVLLTVLTICCLFCLSCSESGTDNISNSAVISYGTSFGECGGYCQKSITISTSEIIHTKKANYNDPQYPDSVKKYQISASEFNDLINSLDIDKFKELDSVIGCPDCRDQGAEWIEIVNKGTTKKVTFEYHDSLPKIQAFLDKIRILFKKYE